MAQVGALAAPAGIAGKADGRSERTDRLAGTASETPDTARGTSASSGNLRRRVGHLKGHSLRLMHAVGSLGDCADSKITQLYLSVYTTSVAQERSWEPVLVSSPTSRVPNRTR